MLNENANPGFTVTREHVTLQVLGVCLHALALICQEFEVEVIPIKKKSMQESEIKPHRHGTADPNQIQCEFHQKSIRPWNSGSRITLRLCPCASGPCMHMPFSHRSLALKHPLPENNPIDICLHLMLCSIESKWCIFWYQINTIWIIWDMHPPLLLTITHILALETSIFW